MKVTVKRTAFALEFSNREAKALGKIMEALAATRTRSPLDWCMRGDDPRALYAQLAGVADVLCGTLVTLRDDETALSPHYAVAKDKTEKAARSVREDRTQSRLTVECPKLPKAGRGR